MKKEASQSDNGNSAHRESADQAFCRVRLPARELVAAILISLLACRIGVAQGSVSKGDNRPVVPREQQAAAARLVAEAAETLRRGDFTGAIVAYEKLVQLAPAVAEFHANLGLAYYSVERFSDAARAYKRAIKLKPGLVNAHYFLGASLAASGQCQEALPYVEKDYPRVKDPQLKQVMALDALRCAMSLNRPDKAVDFVRWLSRDFPNDPEVLYLASHVYSDLATNASQRLLLTAPGSLQAHRLNAEVLEFQGKLEDAIIEYRKVLSLDPRLLGIHYRLGRLLLAAPRTESTLEQARREFEEELKIDPHSAPAEYELGEMKRQARQWEEAIRRFRRAVELDPTNVQALIGLGKSLVSAGRPAEAVAPLESAVKLAPDNPVARYQLSFAYRRVGRDQDAERELVAYREAHDKAQRLREFIRAGIQGSLVQEQTAEPPE